MAGLEIESFMAIANQHRKQDIGEVIFLVSNINSKIIDAFRIDDSIKINAKKYWKKKKET